MASYATVVPAVRLPKDAGPHYDYLVPDGLSAHLRRGSWVVVPWRGRNVDGVVTGISAATAHKGKLRAIAGLGAAERLPEDLLALFEDIAERYVCAAGTVAHAFLPRTPKTKMAEHGPQRPTTRRKRHRPVREVFRYRDPSDRDRAIAARIAKALARGEDAIVVVPHTSDIAPTREAAAALAKDAIVELHGGLSPAAYRRAWLGLLCADAPRIVIGTRQAVAAPVRSLGAILVREADSADLKQYDQNPRYDARTCAVVRAEATGADVALMSHAPRVEDHARTRAPSDRFASVEGTAEGSADTVLVDIAGMPADSETRPLSPATVEAMKTALHGGKRVLVFHNRRGIAAATVCTECGHVARCERCGVAYALHDTTLRCHRCGTERDADGACPACGGSSLRALGIGTASLESRLRALFPEARIARMDAETRDGDGPVPDGDIVIGTRLLLHDAAERADAPRWGAVVATSLDDLLAHPGFRVAEDAWRTVAMLRDVAAVSGASCRLQTMDPENPKIRALLAPYDAFAEAELRARRASGYPPFGTLVAVTVVAKDEKTVERMGAALVRRIRDEFGERSGVTAAGPVRPSTPYRHGMWRRIVLVKAKTMTARLRELLSRLPEDHIVDRDPESIG